MKTIRAIAYALLLYVTPANAMSLKTVTTDTETTVTLKGDIKLGEAKKFIKLADKLSGKVTLVLDSDGGSLDDGIEIGVYVRAHDWETSVTRNSSCASACGLIWLAGTKRHVHDSAGIGFHTAWRGKGKRDPRGNALITSYLAKLGFDASVAQWATKASASGMTWLDESAARKYGIDVE